MNKEQKEVIQDIYTTLGTTVGNQSTEYQHTIQDDNNKWTETVSREEHLQTMIEWALQQIENNFDGVK